MHPTGLFATAARLQDAGTEYALVTVVRAEAPASARPGDKTVVTTDGAIHGWIDGGCAQPAVVKTVRQVLADGKARLIRIAPPADGERALDDVLEFGMACHSGGTLELFVDPVLPRPQLLILGASPVARALSQLAPRVGFAVIVAAHGAQSMDFPDAQLVLDSDDAAALGARVMAGTYVVVATQGRRDLQALRAAITLHAREVSFVASRRKAEVLRASLLAAGADAASVAAIVAPAGYPIAASTPEEIALSVLAALVALRRSGPVSPVEKRETPEPDAVRRTRWTTPATEPAPAASCCGSQVAEPERNQTGEATTVAPRMSGGSCCGA